MRYRTGNHWGVTIVREGNSGVLDRATGRDANDQLVAVVTNGDQALAERICELLNESVGPCSASLPDFFDTEFATSCELRHGHTGDHEAGPTRWREVRS